VFAKDVEELKKLLKALEDWLQQFTYIKKLK
jgi:hypothetical protein